MGGGWANGHGCDQNQNSYREYSIGNLFYKYSDLTSRFHMLKRISSNMKDTCRFFIFDRPLGVEKFSFIMAHLSFKTK